MNTTPERPRTIVVGVDDSPEALAALHWAARLADAEQAHLRIVVAWNQAPATPWNLAEVAEWRARSAALAEQAAGTAGATVGGGLHVESVAIEGSPGRVLADESRQADLVVIGSAGHVGLEGWLTGSVSRHLLHHCGCPLVVLGPNASSDPATRLVTSSTLDPDERTHAWIAGWVAEHPMPVHVFGSFNLVGTVLELSAADPDRHVREVIERRTHHWAARLSEAIAATAPGSAPVECSVHEGDAIDVLDRLTAAGDLIVVPSGCEHSVPIARGECPILVVPTRHHAAAEAAASTAKVVECVTPESGPSVVTTSGTAST